MKIDWDTLPTWPFYTVLYVAMGFVVSESLQVEISSACSASTPLTTQQRLVCGAAWPATAILMIVAHEDPLACFSRKRPREG